MRQTFRALCLAMTLLCAHSASAQAQGQEPRAGELEELGQALEEAKTAYERGDFATARDALLRVYALYPDPKVLYRLALCHERLGEDALAIKAYQSYLDKVPDDPDRARIEGLIRTLQERSAPRTAKLRIQTQPSDALLLIDGSERLEAADASGERLIELSAGEHVIKLSRDGYESQTRTIEVTPAERYTMFIGLQAIRAQDSQWLAWSATGVGGAALVAGVLFLGRAQGAGDVLSALYQTRADEPRPRSYDAQVSTQRRDVQLGWGLVALGVVGLGAGLTLFLWDSPPEEPPAKALLHPSVGPDQLGASVTLEF